MSTPNRLRVLRIYHSGRTPSHRERERQLTTAGVDVTLVVPQTWLDEGGEAQLSAEPFRIIELPVSRPGDVNRHAYSDASALASIVRGASPDVLDVHEEPFSLVARQILRVAPADVPVVMYTAQNVDKRFPPPFAQYEAAAYRRSAALYPCSAQAAAVARGKGFGGMTEVLPLGYDDAVFIPGSQSLDDDEFVLGFFGRLVPEKGLLDAVRLLERVNRVRPSRLIVNGTGPDESRARSLAATLGITDRVEFAPWKDADGLAADYRSTHVVLIPSRPTTTWVEQFGRVIVEGQASGAVVAGYDSGAIREVGGEAAILVPVGALEELTRAVTAVAQDPTQFERHRDLGYAQNRPRTWTHVASQQAAIYRRVAAGEAPRLSLPASPTARRALARAEFGSPAPTVAGDRPFAVPVLREGGRAARLFGWTLDQGSELTARIRARGSQSAPST